LTAGPPTALDRISQSVTPLIREPLQAQRKQRFRPNGVRSQNPPRFTPMSRSSTSPFPILLGDLWATAPTTVLETNDLRVKSGYGPPEASAINKGILCRAIRELKLLSSPPKQPLLAPPSPKQPQKFCHLPPAQPLAVATLLRLASVHAGSIDHVLIGSIGGREADYVSCHQTKHLCRRRGVEIFPVDLNCPRFGQIGEAVRRNISGHGNLRHLGARGVAAGSCNPPRSCHSFPSCAVEEVNF